MDYELLLEKYIAHVGREEGTDFLRGGSPPEWISDAEWDELLRVSGNSDRHVPPPAFHKP